MGASTTVVHACIVTDAQDIIDHRFLQPSWVLESTAHACVSAAEPYRGRILAFPPLTSQSLALTPIRTRLSGWQQASSVTPITYKHAPILPDLTFGLITMSFTQSYYIRTLRKLHDQELRIEYRAAEKRSRAEYRYWKSIRPLRSTSTRYSSYSGHYGPTGYTSAMYPSHTGMHAGANYGHTGHLPSMGGIGMGGMGGIGAHGYPVLPRDRHRLARAQQKYYRRCYEIENKRHRDLERIQNRREQLLGMLNGEFRSEG